MIAAPMTRRQFFGAVAAAVAVALFARVVGSRVARWFDPTRSLQAMLDHGIQIPRGEYTLSRTLYVRRDYTNIEGLVLRSRGDTIFDINAKGVRVSSCVFYGCTNGEALRIAAPMPHLLFSVAA